MLAICSHESNNFTMTLNQYDGGSPSYGICQVKKETASMFGFKGKASELMNPKVNAKYAALYLKYQEKRYGSENWCILSAAFNAGSFNESKEMAGYPRNLRYVRRIQSKLDPLLHYRMVCVQ